jgi:hypothetical protein
MTWFWPDCQWLNGKMSTLHFTKSSRMSMSLTADKLQLKVSTEFCPHRAVVIGSSVPTKIALHKKN